ncbi:MAG: hypothetical protein ACM3PT_03440 [Deltaproteobacteria bacterium]
MGEFEKDIREMFADYELQIETDEIWPGIENKLNKTKRKKRFLWWWITPMLLIIPAGIYFANQNGINSENGNKSETPVSYNNIEGKNKTLTTQNEHINKNTEAQNSTNSIASETKSMSYTFKRLYSKNKSGSAQTKSKTPQSLDYEKKDSEKIIPNSNTFANIDDSGKNPAREILTHSQILLPETKTLHSLIQPYFYNRNFVPGIKIQPKPEKEIDKTQKWNSSIDLAFGFALAGKYIRTREQSFNDYREKRIKTENHLEAMTSSITYNLKNRSGLFFATGIDYCQIDEKFSDYDSIDIYKSGEGVINIITNPDGTIIENRGKKEIIEHKTWNKKIYNYYFFLDIPLSIGYAGKINRINYEVSSGLSYNIAFLKKGQIIGINQYPVDITKESGIFKTRTGLSLISGIKIMVPCKNKMLFIAPKIKYNLQSVTNDDYPLSQNYLTYGIEIGGRIGF